MQVLQVLQVVQVLQVLVSMFQNFRVISSGQRAQGSGEEVFFVTQTVISATLRFVVFT
jgi:hypothetical protein